MQISSRSTHSPFDSCLTFIVCFGLRERKWEEKKLQKSINEFRLKLVQVIH
jgi:hypothetical protein